MAVPGPDGAIDVLIVSVGATTGWRAAARELDPRLVAEDLAPALRAALDDPAPGYAARAAELVAPFSREAVTTTLTQRVLPRLLPGFGT